MQLAFHLLAVIRRLRIYESGRDVQKLSFAATSKAARSHMMPAYQREVLVRFAHCDPAGIVFYARYFEMINGVVEDWFEDALEASFSGLLFHRNLATPTVHFNVDFTGRSMMGDRLTFETSVTRFGTSSFDLCHQVSCRGELRMRAHQTLLFTDSNAKGSQPIPADLKRRMERYYMPENAPAAAAAAGA